MYRIQTPSNVPVPLMCITTRERLNSFNEIWYYGVLLESVDTFQFRLKSDNITVTLLEDLLAEMIGWGISRLSRSFQSPWLPWFLQLYWLPWRHGKSPAKSDVTDSILKKKSSQILASAPELLRHAYISWLLRLGRLECLVLSDVRPVIRSSRLPRYFRAKILFAFLMSSEAAMSLV